MEVELEGRCSNVIVLSHSSCGSSLWMSTTHLVPPSQYMQYGTLTSESALSRPEISIVCVEQGMLILIRLESLDPVIWMQIVGQVMISGHGLLK